MIPRTLFVGRSSTAVCWYRIALPAMALGTDWVGVVGDPPHVHAVTGMIGGGFALERLAEYEVVVIQQPAGRKWLGLIRDLQAAGVTVLYEIDDDVHAVRKLPAHDRAAAFDRAMLAAMELCMDACDGTIVSTDVLARRMRGRTPATWLCRNGIDLKRYALSRPTGAGGRVTIGWAGGTGHRDALVPWLHQVRALMIERPDVHFMSVGQPFGDLLATELGANRATSIPFTPIEIYPAAMRGFDIALAPAGRTAFHRAKSDLRWLEASALGVPTIADPVVYPEIEHGVTGFHASTPAEAGAMMRRLVDDPDLRVRVGAAARDHVAEHRRIEVAAQAWAVALRQAAATAARAA